MSGARTGRFTHSQFQQIPSLALNRQGCVVDIHPADASAYGIGEGERIRVETPRGWVVVAAHLSEVVHQGSIRIAWGWGDLEPECGLNRLTDDTQRNPVIGSPSGRNFMCRIAKVN